MLVRLAFGSRRISTWPACSDQDRAPLTYPAKGAFRSRMDAFAPPGDRPRANIAGVGSAHRYSRKVAARTATIPHHVNMRIKPRLIWGEGDFMVGTKREKEKQTIRFSFSYS